jgi:hypothetical protein
LPVAWRSVQPGEAIAYELDVFHDEMPTFVLDNGIARVVVSANAGARVLTEDARTRDNVPNPPTPSPRDYIAAYTHPIDAGTFNRSYACRVDESGKRAALTCTYTAPDLAPVPVTFTKTFVLRPGEHDFELLRQQGGASATPNPPRSPEPR